jgi:hypothetical protein
MLSFIRQCGAIHCCAMPLQYTDALSNAIASQYTALPSFADALRCGAILCLAIAQQYVTLPLPSAAKHYLALAFCFALALPN